MEGNLCLVCQSLVLFLSTGEDLRLKHQRRHCVSVCLHQGHVIEIINSMLCVCMYMSKKVEERERDKGRERKRY